MFETIITKIAAALFVPFLALTSSFAPVAEPGVGAVLPQAAAVFETSLAAPITTSATSMTLTANEVRGGGVLSGYNCFTIDEGSAQSEYICGTVSGTAVTSMSRGISPLTGTTTVAALQFAHRRGANVKITDFPLIQILKAQNNGEDTFPRVLTYAPGVTPASGGDLTDYEFVTTLAFNGAGVIDASSVARGVVELATGAEAAAGTSNGSSGVLALPASIATSTYGTTSAANRVVVTKDTGKIDFGFQATSTDIQIFTSTTSPGTWTKPVGCVVAKVIEIAGGGAGGAGGRNSGSASQSGGSGGSNGGYSVAELPCSALTTTVAVNVGAGGLSVAGRGTSGTGSNGNSGTNSTFGSFLSARGGNGGNGGANNGNGTSATSSAPVATPGSIGFDAVYWLTPLGQFATTTPGSSGFGGGSVGLINGFNAPPCLSFAPCGGGGGGGSDGGNNGNGGTGGNMIGAITLAGGASGVGNTAGSAGSDGASQTAGNPFGGAGGGGGGAGNADNGGNGGGGGLYGGGGGGGGASNDGTSGAGGKGGDGIVVVITYR
jgi:hypothetical protein